MFWQRLWTPKQHSLSSHPVQWIDPESVLSWGRSMISRSRTGFTRQLHVFLRHSASFESARYVTGHWIWWEVMGSHWKSLYSRNADAVGQRDEDRLARQLRSRGACQGAEELWAALRFGVIWCQSTYPSHHTWHTTQIRWIKCVPAEDMLWQVFILNNCGFYTYTQLYPVDKLEIEYDAWQSS